MPNHKFVPGVDASGLQGSNVIYAGTGGDGTPLFVHMDGATVETPSQMRTTVQGYSPASRQDSNILNYKFTQRYRPRFPPCLQ